MKNQIKEYQLVPHVMLSEDKPKVIVNMGRRSGKTFILCKLSVEHCESIPNTTITYMALSDSRIREVKRIIKNLCSLKCSETTDTITFPNGSEIRLIKTKPQVIETDYCFIDEIGTNNLNDVIKDFKPHVKIKCAYTDWTYDYE